MIPDRQRWRFMIVALGIVAGLTAAVAVSFRSGERSRPARPTARVSADARISAGEEKRRADLSRQGYAARFADQLLKIEERCRFENAASAVRFVGSEECGRCHESIAREYFRTGMGQSLALMPPERDAERKANDGLPESEPPDGVIEDRTSARRYRVVRRDGVMWHQELLPAGRRESDRSSSARRSGDVVLGEYPVRWQIGSGRHARSYLVEIDGFLIESPVTWYSSRQAWGMSPGYDRPGHPGFSRVAESGCLYCHAGDARPMDGTSHRLTIHEASIGCERCHGPGQLHVQRHEGSRSLSRPADSETADASAVTIDTSIVNPRHLDRELSDSICGQCHLRSAATVLVPGARLDDFRPGMSLADLRTDYRFEPVAGTGRLAKPGEGSAAQSPDGAMTVVGHIEQLRLSRCYQQSTLSCVTCHDPHGAVSREERAGHYRSVCLQCHGSQDCRVPDSERQLRSPGNDCTVCHMPRSGTDIPHLTFTHHRIGLHPERTSVRSVRTGPAAGQSAGRLVPLTDSAFLPEQVKAAMLGLACLEFSGRNEGQAHAGFYRNRAYRLLTQAWQQGERSPEIASALVALGARDDVPGLPESVRNALESPDITADMRVNFLLSTAFVQADRRRFARAAARMQQVVAVRRDSEDWLLLGDFAQAAGDAQRAAQAFETSLRISPLNGELRRWLVDYYVRTNERDKADRHLDMLRLVNESQAEPAGTR